MANDSKHKQMKVKQKDYLGLVHPPQAAQLWGSRNFQLKESEKQSRKDQQVKVKLKDYLAIMEMDGQHDKHKNSNKSLLKSTKQKREVFIDGGQPLSQEKTKRMAFSQSETNYKGKERNDKLHAQVVRYHSPREVSEVLEDCHSSPRPALKHGRRCLKEESPDDFGAYLHDKFSNWLPRAGASVKKKIPVSGNSKSYNLLKSQVELDRSMSNSSESKKSSHEDSTKEIYISLDKKSPREKTDCINKFGDYEGLQENFGASNNDTIMLKNQEKLGGKESTY